MALIVLAADKGSPGVTTSAVALAAVWPHRALYAECDAHGGDLVYRMPAEHGGPLDPNRGLVSLAVEARRGFDASILPQHTQRLRGGLELMVGLGNADQSHGMAGLWGPLGRAFDRYGDLPYGADVIADCGRLGPDSPTLDLIAQSALVLLIARTEAESLAHVRDRANSLSARLHATQGSSVSLARPPIGIVLIAPPNRARQTAKQVGDLLAASTAGAEVLGVLAYDEQGAEALAGRGRGRVDKALLTRSARELAGTISRRYGLIRPAAGHVPAPAAPPAAAPPTIPIDPSAVQRAGSQGVPAMPPNLTSVPHPQAYPAPHGATPPQGPYTGWPQQNPQRAPHSGQPQNPHDAPPPQGPYPGPAQSQDPYTGRTAQNPYTGQSRAQPQPQSPNGMAPQSQPQSQSQSQSPNGMASSSGAAQPAQQQPQPAQQPAPPNVAARPPQPVPRSGTVYPTQESQPVPPNGTAHPTQQPQSVPPPGAAHPSQPPQPAPPNVAAHPTQQPQPVPPNGSTQPMQLPRPAQADGEAEPQNPYSAQHPYPPTVSGTAA